VRAPARIIFLNGGILLVALSVALPWADVGGRARSGPSFANLLLSLPELPLLGSHLRAVAFLWYSVPFLALITWVTQFRSWPPAVDRWTRAAGIVLVLATALMIGWLALRDVGFPSAGAACAGVGAALVAVALIAPSPRPSTRPAVPTE
jgi:hypothetical protein